MNRAKAKTSYDRSCPSPFPFLHRKWHLFNMWEIAPWLFPIEVGQAVNPCVPVSPPYSSGLLSPEANDGTHVLLRPRGCQLLEWPIRPSLGIPCQLTGSLSMRVIDFKYESSRSFAQSKCGELIQSHCNRTAHLTGVPFSHLKFLLKGYSVFWQNICRLQEIRNLKSLDSCVSIVAMLGIQHTSLHPSLYQEWLEDDLSIRNL